MSALPFETEEYCYLIKFPVKEDVDLEVDDLGGASDDEMNLDGCVEGDDEEEEDDEVEKPMDNLEDLEVADED